MRDLTISGLIALNVKQKQENIMRSTAYILSLFLLVDKLLIVFVNSVLIALRFCGA